MKRIFLFYIIFFKLNYIISTTDCSSNCKKCDSIKICTKCENSYSLIGIKEYSINNEITCTNVDLTTYYFVTSEGVHYPCTNDDYVYFRGDNTKCYKRDVLAINDYYTYDVNNKMFYPCNDGYYGIDNCKECIYSDSTLKCLKCKNNYVFLDNDFNTCYLVDSLNNNEYYKVDDYNYASCTNINNCLYCSNKNTCIQCQGDYFLVNFNHKDCILGTEITPSDEYYLEDYTYYSCGLNGGVSNCKKCISKTSCTECESGYTIIDDDLTTCVEKSSLNSQLYYTLDNGINYKSCKNIPDKYCLECEIINSVDTNNLEINCNKCQDGYIFLDNVKTHCFLEESLNNEYYKVDNNNYKSCSSSIARCTTCESENHCLTCEENYGVLDEDYSQCQNIDAGLTAKTIFKEDIFYYSCSIIEGCEKCDARNNCLETVSDYYCILNGIPMKLNKIKDPYYYSGFDCYPCSIGVSNCQLCSADNICYQCKEGYTIIDEDRGNCVYRAGYSNNDQYFTLDNGINYYSCGSNLNEKAIENCEKCEYNKNLEKNNCIKCVDTYIILDDDGSICISQTSIQSQIDDNKMIDNGDNTKYYTCNKIIANCDTCDALDNCLTCKQNYIFLNDDKSKCLDKNNYISGHYYSNDGINYYSCLDNCFDCDNGSTCEKCDEGYELNEDFKNKCEKTLYDDNDIKENCVYITKKIEEDEDEDEDDVNNINLDDLINNLIHDDYYPLYSNNKHYLVKYINEKINYTIIVFKNDQCSLYLYEDNIFHINSSEIINELKKYSISNEIIECIVIYKNQTGISFFENIDGSNINIKDLCPSCLQKKYIINYNYKNKLTNDIGEKLTEVIGNENIDIFNENSEYFQTFCKILQIEGIDMPLNKRKYLLYQGNLSYNLNDSNKGDLYACNVQCTLIDNNPENYTSECACDLYYDIKNFIKYANNIEEKHNEVEYNKSEIDDDYYFLNNSKDSFEMFTCSNYAFTGENIKKNAGFYVVFFSFTSQVGCLIFLFCKIKINSFAKLLVIANPPPFKQKNKKEEQKGEIDENNKKRVVKRVTDIDYYLTSTEEAKNNNINNTNLPSSQKRFNSNENENVINVENQNNFEHNGEIHHQRLNIFNNNYVTPSTIKLGSKKNYKENSSNKDTNNDEDLFSQDQNSEMDYYPVIKFIEYDVNVYRDIGYSYEQKDIKELRKKYEGIKVIQYNLLNKNEKTKLLPLIYKSLLKDHLPYKYGIYYDKRKFLSFYLYLLCLRNPIINLFINSNNNSQNFIPFSVKLIKIIFTGIMILFFNALFINQKYIYNKYNYFDEKFNFKKMLISDTINSSEKLIYSINHSFVNSILSYIIIMIIDSFLNWLFSIRRRVKNLLDEYYEIDSGRNSTVSRYNKERKNFEKDLLHVSDLKTIYIWITIIFYIFMIIFFIYLVNFCSIYKGVVADLFLGALWTFIIYIFMPFLSTLIISGLRYLGLKVKILFFYNLSRILMEI